MTADLLDTLKDVLEAAHQRFFYVQDKDLWGRADHWETDEQIPDTGQLVGDCDCFAIACRKALKAKGMQSRLIFCGVNNPAGDHLILECQGYLLDNRKLHVTNWQDSDYTLLRISGFNPGDAWHKIATEVE